MKILKIISCTNIIIWFFDGIIIIGSILNEINSFLMNIIIGLIFLSASYFLYKKHKNSQKILSFQHNAEEQLYYRQFLKTEIIMNLASLLIGFIIFSGVFSRTFLEKMPVFD